ncbi:MAG: shikimate dehydrogenase [Anaerostipes sp.]|jgi:shikimate dehydrogenase|nr:shikimate dehydrogenase [Anaerostipes sp.]MDD3745057.1 shikimate dehydrogenase [Anaerostipes sp.]
MDTRISGKTRLLGVFGTPIKHSGSPIMYNYCFDYYGLDCAYLAFETDVPDVKDTLAAMRRLDMRGGNVTMPCKQEVARNMDKLSPAAKFIGAVNTIVNDNGVLTGHITDGEGVVRDLLDHGISIKGEDIVLLGAGGAATAIMVQCALDGAKSVTVFNRGEEGLLKAERIGTSMMEDGVDCKMEYHLLEENQLMHDIIRKSGVLINATSVGMKPMNEGVSLVTDVTALHKDLIVYDVIYNPLVTKLMEDAQNQGCKAVIGGKGMLLWQGAAAFELYTGLEMPAEGLKKLLEEREVNPLPVLKDV